MTQIEIYTHLGNPLDRTERHLHLRQAIPSGSDLCKTQGKIRADGDTGARTQVYLRCHCSRQHSPPISHSVRHATSGFPSHMFHQSASTSLPSLLTSIRHLLAHGKGFCEAAVYFSTHIGQNAPPTSCTSFASLGRVRDRMAIA